MVSMGGKILTACASYLTSEWLKPSSEGFFTTDCPFIGMICCQEERLIRYTGGTPHGPVRGGGAPVLRLPVKERHPGDLILLMNKPV